MLGKGFNISIALLVALACSAPSVASGQWSQRPTLVELPSGAERWGISVGSYRIAPSLAIGGRYDSNLYREDENEEPTSAGILTIEPGIDISNPNGKVVRLHIAAKGDIRIYFSDDKNVEEQRNSGATFNLDLHLFPRSAVSLRIFDKFTRALQTRNWATSGNYNRNFNLAGLQLLFRPGGGALEFGLEYAFAFDFFDEFSRGDKRYHDFGFHTMWKFYPLTALFLDVDFKIVSYDETYADTKLGLQNVDSMPLRAQLGLRGYITKKLSVLLQAGWAQGFYDSGPSFSGPIGTARFSYRVTPTTMLQLGYAHDYEDSFHSNYYGEHRIFLSAQQQLWRRLTIDLGGSFAFNSYGSFEPEATTGYKVNEVERAEQALRLDAGASVDVTRWLAFKVGYRYEALFSDFAFDLIATGEPVDAATYYRHQVFASIIGRY